MISWQAATIRWPNKTELALPAISLQPGDRVALLGSNGAGKTTLLRSVAGLDAILENQVRINGATLQTLPLYERAKKIGYLPAETHFAYPFSIRDVVCWGRFAMHQGQPKAADWEAVTHWLDAFDLMRLQEMPITAVSSGEKQRALMARLFAGETPLKILDEPFARLDMGQAGRIRALWQNPSLRDHILLVAHHDIFNLFAWATRILLITDGSLIECPMHSESETLQFIAHRFENRL